MEYLARRPGLQSKFISVGAMSAIGTSIWAFLSVGVAVGVASETAGPVYVSIGDTIEGSPR